MDITNIIATHNLSATDIESEIDEAEEFDDESSTYDIDVKETKDKNELSTKQLNDILEGNEIDFNVTDSIFQHVVDNPYYQKLPENKKTLILNRLHERIQKKNKKTTTTSRTATTQASNAITAKKSHFYCKNCGFNKKIADGTFIYSKNVENNEDTYDLNFQEYYNDPTLPITKKYICINESCETHKHPEKKSAVFYRFNGTYRVRYICGVCKSFWFNA
jgi:hypothetical protein